MTRWRRRFGKPISMTRLPIAISRGSDCFQCHIQLLVVTQTTLWKQSLRRMKMEKSKQHRETSSQVLCNQVQLDELTGQVLYIYMQVIHIKSLQSLVKEYSRETPSYRLDTRLTSVLLKQSRTRSRCIIQVTHIRNKAFPKRRSIEVRTAR